MTWQVSWSNRFPMRPRDFIINSRPQDGQRAFPLYLTPDSEISLPQAEQTPGTVFLPFMAS